MVRVIRMAELGSQEWLAQFRDNELDGLAFERPPDLDANGFSYEPVAEQPETPELGSPMEETEL